MTRAGAPYDWPDFWDTYDRGEWEPETKAVLERFLHEDDLFIDIGAWSGPVTLWAVALHAHVLALEPDAVAYGALRDNTKHVRKQVECYQVALHHKIGGARLANDHFGNSQSRIAENGTQWTMCWDPKMLFRIARRVPALIKCDVEGAETLFLEDLAARCHEHKVPLYLSWHQPWWPEPVDDEEREHWLRGFELEAIRGDGWTGFSELLATPRSA